MCNEVPLNVLRSQSCTAECRDRPVVSVLLRFRTESVLPRLQAIPAKNMYHRVEQQSCIFVSLFIIYGGKNPQSQTQDIVTKIFQCGLSPSTVWFQTAE